VGDSEWRGEQRQGKAGKGEEGGERWKEEKEKGGRYKERKEREGTRNVTRMFYQLSIRANQECIRTGDQSKSVQLR